jgi:hypothetical protein
MTAPARYRVTTAFPWADLRGHASAVTAVTGGGPLTCAATGNAPRPAATREVTPWA